MSRLEGNEINNGTNDQEDMMLEIMDALKGTVTLLFLMLVSCVPSFIMQRLLILHMINIP